MRNECKFKIGGIIYADQYTRLYGGIDILLDKKWMPLAFQLTPTKDGNCILANSIEDVSKPTEILFDSFNTLCAIKAVRITAMAIHDKNPEILHVVRNLLDISFEKEGGSYGVMIRVQFPAMLLENETMEELLKKTQNNCERYQDNIDTVVFYKVTEPRKFVYGVENPILALSNLTATTLRNIIGTMDLDKTLISRDEINSQMTVLLDEATDPWGIKVLKVELKTITPPADIQAAMEKQMQAERDKRAKILDAEAHKEASIRRAEGEKAATILSAEAERDAAIAKATGQAEATRLAYEAEAKGLELLNQTNLKENVITIKKLEALKELGDGKATKIIVPTELASSASNLNYVADMLGTPSQEPVRKDNSMAKPEITQKSDPCCDTNFPDGRQELCCEGDAYADYS